MTRRDEGTNTVATSGDGASAVLGVDPMSMAGGRYPGHRYGRPCRSQGPPRLARIVRRPASAWTLSALYAGAGLKCLFDLAAPLGADMPVWVRTTVGMTSLLVAGLICLVDARWTGVAVHQLLGGVTAMTTMLVASSATLGGAMIAAVGYQSVGIYAGFFLSRRATAAHLITISAGFAVGLASSGLPETSVAAWLTVSGATTITALALSSLTRQLRRFAQEDPVTGALSRAGLSKAAGPLLAAAERHGQPLAAVVIDLDGFKQINDSAGHAAGDQLLATVAVRWRAQLRQSDELARTGGDEFVILAPGTDDQGARALSKRLMAEAGTACSAGSAMYRPGDTLAALVSRADAEMYRVKKGGAVTVLARF
ncbi:MAG: diguanylate cyclase [Actinomycetota bacterium]|nr:diguanylate cyclase [Actinomycetota bacterium]